MPRQLLVTADSDLVPAPHLGKAPDLHHFGNVALQTFCMAIFVFMTKINKLPAIKQWKRAGRRPVQRGPAAQLRTYLR